MIGAKVSSCTTARLGRHRDHRRLHVEGIRMIIGQHPVAAAQHLSALLDRARQGGLLGLEAAAG